MAYRILKSTRQLVKYIKNPALRKPSRLLFSHLSDNPSAITQEGIFTKKLNQLVLWYEETTGMDEVRMAQKRVLDAEERFISAQDRRRESNKEVVLVQNKLKELHAELDSTTRGEERYVAIITEEHKLLKQERHVTNEFKRYEREEREHFSALSSAVKESHEKERAQAERTKYWSIIGSIIGTIIGIVGSSINNELKMKELRRLIKESTTVTRTDEVSVTSPDVLSRYEKELSVLANEMNASLKENEDVVHRLNKVINVLDNKVKSNLNADSDTVLEALSQQQVVLERNLQEMKAILATQTSTYPSTPIEPMYVSKQNSEDNEKAKLLFLSTILVVFPLIFRYFDLFS